MRNDNFKREKSKEDSEREVIGKKMVFCTKKLDFVLKIRYDVLKSQYSVLKIWDFVLKISVLH